MPDVLKFNVNNYVRVRLTDRGRELWAQWYRDLNIEPRDPPVDKDGYTRLQAWELMQRLGHGITMGRPSPFETEILIET